MSQTQRDTRIELSNEWHARPGLSLPPPFHCTHVVELTNDEAAAALTSELVQFCREHLADVKCPRSIDYRDELPRHPTGKLYKRLLKDEYWKAAGRSI